MEPTLITLDSLGWDAAAFATPQLAPPAAGGAGLDPARVVAHDRERYRVLTPAGELQAELAGRLRHEAQDRLDLPVVGDWVAIAARLAEGRATIHGRSPRRTLLVRKDAGPQTRPQPLAANVDVVLLVVGADRDLNPRRIERYLQAIAESGAAAVIVLNKIDACPDPELALSLVRGSAPGVEVHPLSALSGLGVVEALAPHLAPSRTAALIGSSGVGKSTVLNRLVGAPAQATGAVRAADGRGRHTTTRRSLLPLPSGALLIDTPGLRALQPWSEGEGLDEAFPEIAARASACRFRDCTHEHEPGCAVVQALDEGELDEARYLGFVKLGREQERFARRASARARQDEKRRNRRLSREVRRRQREKWGD